MDFMSIIDARVNSAREEGARGFGRGRRREGASAGSRALSPQKVSRERSPPK